MTDVGKALAYAQTYGDTVQQARLASVLWDGLASAKALQDLAGLQQPDGSFAFWLPQVGNVRDTACVLQWFDDLKVHCGAVVERACLAWLLRCLHDAGLPAEQHLVTRALQDLERKQRWDGSWAAEEGEGEEQAVRAAVDALRALSAYGCIAHVPRLAKSQESHR